MKIIFESPTPVMLAHGGAQVQIEQTKKGLEANGVQVEYLRWWDKTQCGDLIHYFGSPTGAFLGLARAAVMPVVMTNLFSETCNRSRGRLLRQRWLIQTALKIPVARSLKSQLNWRIYNRTTHNVVGLTAEKFVLETVYCVPAEKISIVPLGLSETFLQAGAGDRQTPHLICVGTITENKNSVALAELAHAAQAPILFVGKPYSEKNPYWLRFKKLIDGRWVKHLPHTEDESEMVSLLRAARGCVIMSQFENWCLAAHEGIACGLPLLVQDQNWSRERFGGQPAYFPDLGFTKANAAALKNFYDAAPQLTPPKIRLHSWQEVGQQLKTIYEKVLARPAEPVF